MKDVDVLPQINALWVGEQLNKTARACLQSFIMRGHQVNLYTYAQVGNLPDDICICDANVIIHHSKIIRHKKTGSYALFSDIFRYELLQKVGGIYVDCDVYCLKPLTVPESGYLFGYEEDTKINGAVLATPKNSQLLNQLRDIVDDNYFIPPWYSKTKQLRYKVRKFLGMSRHISDMPWGVIGPDAITYFAKSLQVDSLAQEIDVLYPVHYLCISHLLTPHLDIQDITTHRTLCIHLYNEMLKSVELEELSEDCVLYKMLNNLI